MAGSRRTAAQTARTPVWCHEPFNLTMILRLEQLAAYERYLAVPSIHAYSMNGTKPISFCRWR
jgi:hypothetical protein